MTTVYILKSTKDQKRIYIGVTENLEKRLEEHNRSNSGYSKIYSPWSVETYMVFKNKFLAGRFEKYLKVGSGQAFLKKRLIPSISAE